MIISENELRSIKDDIERQRIELDILSMKITSHIPEVILI